MSMQLITQISITNVLIQIVLNIAVYFLSLKLYKVLRVENKALKLENSQLKKQIVINCRYCNKILTYENKFISHYSSYMICKECAGEKETAITLAKKKHLFDTTSNRHAPIIREQDELFKLDVILNNSLKQTMIRYCGKSRKDCGVDFSDYETCFKCKLRREKLFISGELGNNQKFISDPKEHEGNKE